MKRSGFMFKKYLSLLLCLTMVFSCVSFSAQAARGADDAGPEIACSEEGIPDANLYAALCKAAGTETLHENDLAQATELDLRRSEIASLAGLQLLNLDNLQTLDLSRNSLTAIAAESLSALPALTHLNLENNGFTDLTAIEMASDTLEILDLSNEAFTELPEGAFQNLDLPALKQLYFYENDIADIAPGAFEGAPPQLEWLDLSYNSLSQTPVGAFEGLSQLTTLDLEYNEVEVFSEMHFDGLDSLENLLFSWNNLEALESGDFDREGLRNLKYIDFRRNAIDNVPAGTFAGADSIVSIDFTSNVLENWTYVDEDTPYVDLTGLDNLETLDLNDTWIKTLPADAFAAMPKLKTLIVSTTYLEALVPGTFRGLAQLETLDLSGNRVTNIPAGAFEGLGESLTTLSLWNNDIESIEETAFAGLTGLQRLNLSNNKLAALPDLTGLTALNTEESENNWITNFRGNYLLSTELADKLPAQLTADADWLLNQAEGQQYTVVSVTQPGDVSVEKGDVLFFLQLPNQLTATMEDGGTYPVTVFWDSSPVNINAYGTYPITGKVPGYSQPVHINVIVARPPRTDPIPSSAFTVSANSVDRDQVAIANAFDGDNDTRWHTKISEPDSYPYIVEILFNETHTINEVQYVPRQDETDNGTIQQMAIYAGADAASAVKVGDYTLVNDKTTKIMNFDAVEADYVKFEITQGVGGWASASEFRLYDASVPLSKTEIVSVAASSTQPNNNTDIENAFDNNNDTKWHSKWDEVNQYPVTVEATLKSSHVLHKAQYVPRQDSQTNGIITSLSVYVGADAESAVKVGDYTLAGDATVKWLEFEPTAGSYIRFEIHAGLAGFASAAEFRLYETYEEPQPDTYDVTVASVVGGTAAVTADKQIAAAGETVTVRIADVEAGKRFQSIAVTDASGASVDVAEVTAGEAYTFTMPASAVTITVTLSAPVDKSGLEELFELCGVADEKDFTPATWAEMVKVWDEAKLVYENPNATQEQVTGAYDALYSALENLKIRANTAELQKTIEEAAAVRTIIDRYTSTGKAEFLRALDAAEIVLANGEATQAEVNSARAALSEAMAVLVPKGDKTPLAEMIAGTMELNPSTYTAESWAGLQTALAAANRVMANEDVTEENVQTALKELARAIAELKPAETPTHPELDALVKAALLLKEENYTAPSWSVFRAALTVAQTILEDPDATDAELDSAYNVLSYAMRKLAYTADASTLRNLVAAAEKLVPDLEEQYVPEGQAEFLKALDDAKLLLENKDATQSETDAMAARLLETMMALRVKPDKALLEKLLTEGEQFELSGYTASSAAMYRAALRLARTVYENPNATQEDVQSACTQMRNARILLVKDPGTTPEPSAPKGKKQTSRMPARNTYGKEGYAVVSAAQSVLAPAAVRCDTTKDFTLQRGSSYCFKITAANGIVPRFTVGNGSVLKTQFVKQAGSDYYYTVYAIGKAGESTGVYMAVGDGAPQKQCVVTIG
ncbi:leucine-rich repeat domain-containing protein [Anaeromassilibacillus senegalensis]|uniref:leucine-rich repeat domain-containing protein n=1 Tax=Anaeromassilibacillus senegalensis TaxID=1673717 RepID=UPI0009E64CA2|nr:leucine-rich repeat domain-containing protein [Anaeromassilibacillus senegalensis]